MTRTTIGLVIGAGLLIAAAAEAQTSGAPAKFSGIKLVDMTARTPEQTVTLSFDRESLRIVEPTANSTIRSFAYADLTVTHTVSSAPPPSAGNPSAVPTGSASLPMYMGKTPRNWLTLSSGDGKVTLRVSAKVYDQVKAELAERQVAIGER
jgi:hypothetical protein